MLVQTVELTICSNRRDIWAGSDMRGAGADRSKWNLRLLEEVWHQC